MSRRPRFARDRFGVVHRILYLQDPWWRTTCSNDALVDKSRWGLLISPAVVTCLACASGKAFD